LRSSREQDRQYRASFWCPRRWHLGHWNRRISFPIYI